MNRVPLNWLAIILTSATPLAVWAQSNVLEVQSNAQKGQMVVKEQLGNSEKRSQQVQPDYDTQQHLSSDSQNTLPNVKSIQAEGSKTIPVDREVSAQRESVAETRAIREARRLENQKSMRKLPTATQTVVPAAAAILAVPAVTPAAPVVDKSKVVPAAPVFMPLAPPPVTPSSKAVTTQSVKPAPVVAPFTPVALSVKPAAAPKPPQAKVQKKLPRDVAPVVPKQTLCQDFGRQWQTAASQAETSSVQAEQLLTRLLACPQDQERLVTLYKAQELLGEEAVLRLAMIEDGKKRSPAINDEYQTWIYGLRAANAVKQFEAKDYVAAHRALQQLTPSIRQRRDLGLARLAAENDRRLQQPANALVWSQQALLWSDNSEADRLTTAWLLLDLKREAEAEAIAKTLPVTSEASRSLAVIITRNQAVRAYKSRRFDEAETLLMQLKTQTGQQLTAEDQSMLGWTLFQAGKLRLALDEFKDSYRQKPEAGTAQGVVFSAAKLQVIEEAAALANDIGGPLTTLLADPPLQEALAQGLTGKELQVNVSATARVNLIRALLPASVPASTSASVTTAAVPAVVAKPLPYLERFVKTEGQPTQAVMPVASTTRLMATEATVVLPTTTTTTTTTVVPPVITRHPSEVARQQQLQLLKPKIAAKPAVVAAVAAPPTTTAPVYFYLFGRKPAPLVAAATTLAAVTPPATSSTTSRVANTVTTAGAKTDGFPADFSGYIGQGTLQDLWTGAETAYNRGDERNALSIYELIIRQHSHDGERFATLNQARTLLGAIKVWPLARLERNHRSRSKAVEQQFRPWLVSLQNDMVVAYFGNKQYDEAEKMLTSRAGEIIANKDQGMARLLAETLAAQKRPEALTWRYRVLDWSDNRPEDRISLAWTLIDLGRDADAAELMASVPPTFSDEAISIHTVLMRKEAVQAFEQKDYDYALSTLDAMDKLNKGTSADDLALRGWINLQKGDAKKSYNAFERSYSLKADSGSAQGVVFSAMQASQLDAAYRLRDKKAGGPLDALLADEAIRHEINLGVPASAMKLTIDDDAKLTLQQPTLQPWLINGGLVTRNKSGESGQSKLNEQRMLAFRTGIEPYYGHRLSFEASAFSLDSGSASNNAFIGSNIYSTPPVRQRNAITRATGQEFLLQYNGQLTATTELELKIGTVPDVLFKQDVRGGIALASRGDDMSYRLELERLPVKESILSYIGQQDPYSQLTWGRVMETRLKLSGSSGSKESWRLDGGVTLGQLKGERVASNNKRELYVWFNRPILAERFDLRLGPVFFYQGFDDNLSGFSVGHGGYFSPSSLIRLGGLIDFRKEVASDYFVAAKAGLGWQASQQDCLSGLSLASGCYKEGTSDSGLATELQLGFVKAFGKQRNWLFLGINTQTSPQYNDLSFQLSWTHAFGGSTEGRVYSFGLPDFVLIKH